MNGHIDKDITLKDVSSDVLISTVLITGAWFTNHLGQAFFSQGLPLSDSVLIYARTVITILWAIRMVVRYSICTYSEINSAIITVISSQTWKASQIAIISSIKYLWTCWKKMHNLPRYLIIIVFIIGLSLAIFMFTQNSADVWLPPTYSAAVLLLVYLLEKDNLQQQSGSRHYWLAILIVFCIIQICIGIGIIDILYLNNTDILSEVWKLTVHLPYTQLSTANNLRILASMSVMYLITDKIYQRHASRLIGYTKYSKSFFDQIMPWCQKIPALGIA